MKTALHPQYYPHAAVRCACGSQFSVGSTKENLQIEVCSRCHPFYTGQEKIVDVAGRVQRYQKIVAQAKNKAKPQKQAAKTPKGKGKLMGNNFESVDK